MTPDEILLEAEEKMIKTEEFVQHEFTGVRTGKASPALVENLMADVYGSQMRIREIAGINPVIHGKAIRLILPELSTERRQEMVKMANKMSEDGRVAIRHVRRDAMELLRKAKAAGLSEDEEKNAEK